jgi:proline iminopeptidase
VVIYDQLGCGKSDRVTDTTLFTVDRFVRELQTVRDSLGLDEIHLLGHSWGAMLAQAYMGTSPKGVRSVILSSPLVTTAQWEADADSMLRLMPDSFRTAIIDHEVKGKPPGPRYRSAIRAYYKEHMTRGPVRWPADADSSREGFGEKVYSYMWGPSEVRSTGTLKNFDGRPWLRMITVPTLFMTGEFDEAPPGSVRQFAALVPGSRMVVIPGAGHSTHNDNLAAVLGGLEEFLASVEQRRPP